MKRQWIMSAVALLSLAGTLGLGCAAQVNEATEAKPVTGEALTSAENVDTATEALAQHCFLDGCHRPHDACTCANTGWSGYCGYGPHHPRCLYCRCD